MLKISQIPLVKRLVGKGSGSSQKPQQPEKASVQKGGLGKIVTTAGTITAFSLASLTPPHKIADARQFINGVNSGAGKETVKEYKCTEEPAGDVQGEISNVKCNSTTSDSDYKGKTCSSAMLFTSGEVKPWSSCE